MSNILDYISWRGDLSFENSKFNDIDALILCQISYLNFDGLLSEMNFSNKVTLKELSEAFKNSSDFEKRCDTGALINRLTVQLFFDTANSCRFKNILITGYTSKIDLEKEEQFSAMTYILSDNINFIAYRGTDDTIVGWKEDFNLAIIDEVPAQIDALMYLEKASNSMRGRIFVGGHSKGGNLAVFASAMVSNNIKKRIETVYNMDGPGFSDSKLEMQEFNDIIPKICSYYPHFSIVGMLFSHAGVYSVVESDESGIMQHDPFSWHLKGKCFVLKDGFDKASSFFHETFNTWVSEMEPKQREQFIETLFSVIQATDARTNSEIENNMIGNSVKIIKAFHDLTPDSRNAIYKTIRMLFQIAHKRLPSFAEYFETDELKNNARKKVDDVAKKIRKKVKNI